MKKTLVFILTLMVGGIAMADSSFYNYKVTTIQGDQLKLDAYKGKPVLVVNIATQCGYTPQLKGLETLYQKYKDKGFVVVGVPSNDFGGQTPEDNKDVKKFCELNYGVTFPLTAKTVVKGDKKDPWVTSLIQQSKDKKEIGWNFEKFLMGPDGQLVERFSSGTKPEAPELTQKIESLLK